MPCLLFKWVCQHGALSLRRICHQRPRLAMDDWFSISMETVLEGWAAKRILKIAWLRKMSTTSCWGYKYRILPSFQINCRPWFSLLVIFPLFKYNALAEVSENSNQCQYTMKNVQNDRNEPIGAMLCDWFSSRGCFSVHSSATCDRSHSATTRHHGRDGYRPQQSAQLVRRSPCHPHRYEL